MDQASYQELLFERDGRVLTIVMNRPEALNAVNHALHQEMARVFSEAAQDSGSDVIVLTGAGSAFSAGGDLTWLKSQLDGSLAPLVAEREAARQVVRNLLDCPKPTIARINGDAIGFGATVALLCDISIAARGARLADPHVRIGLAAGDGGALIWPQLIGFARARHYLLTGDMIEAEEAAAIGLVSFAVDPAELDAFVSAYANRLAAGAQTAIRYTKTAINLGLRGLVDSVFEAGLALEVLSKQSAEFREGVQAFIDKRHPNFPPIEG